MSCLADAAAAFDPELLLAACAAAVTTVRGGARGRVAVLDFFSQQLAPRLAQQAADDGPCFGGSGGGGVLESRAMRAWLRRVNPLAGTPFSLDHDHDRIQSVHELFLQWHSTFIRRALLMQSSLRPSQVTSTPTSVQLRLRRWRRQSRGVQQPRLLSGRTMQCHLPCSRWPSPYQMPMHLPMRQG